MDVNNFLHNIKEINGLNQRGGRMLSVIDLIIRGTLSIEMASYLFVAIHYNASFLCCALEGGVGKTALMGALLGCIPPSERIESCTSTDTIKRLSNYDRQEKISLVVHEIGRGHWFGYLWGPPVLEFVKLNSNPMIRVVSNIHADTYSQVTDQFRLFGDPDGDYLKYFDLILFIKILDGMNWRQRRRVVFNVLELQETDDNEFFHAPLFVFDEDDGFKRTGMGIFGHRHDALKLTEKRLRALVKQEVVLLEDLITPFTELHAELDDLS
ncbi:MAG: hypothetical protein ACTSWN_03630 [Promethearchaeota archaeon]